MAVGGIGKKMLGFADEVWAGMSKGVGDGAAKKLSTSVLNSNKSTLQKAAVRNLKTGAGNSGKITAKNITNTKIGGSIKVAKQNAKKVSLTGGKIAGDSCGVRLGDNLVGGYRDTIKGMKGKDLTMSNVKAAAKTAFSDPKTGKLSTGKVAGAVVTAGVAGRVVTGGGLYRDRNGAVNIPGIPLL